MTRAVIVILAAFLLAQPSRDQPRSQTQPTDAARGTGVIGGRVVLDDVFPADGDRHYPASRYVASTSADRQGRYRFEALPPADYYVAAASRGRVNVAPQLDDAEFFESLVAGASRVGLGDGAHVSVQVKLADR